MPHYLHLLPRSWAADVNPLISPNSSLETHQRIDNLLLGLRNHASEVFEDGTHSLPSSNPLYSMVQAALHYEAQQEARTIEKGTSNGVNDCLKQLAVQHDKPSKPKAG